MKAILKFLAGLSTLFVLGALFIPVLLCADHLGPYLDSWALALAIGATLCVLATTGLAGFRMWLKEETRRQKEERDAVRERERDTQNNTIQDLRQQLEVASKKPAPEPLPKEQRLLELAEKLRTKTTRETNKEGTTTVIKDKIPEEVMAEILPVLTQIYKPSKNTQS